MQPTLQGGDAVMAKWFWLGCTVRTLTYDVRKQICFGQNTPWLDQSFLTRYYLFIYFDSPNLHTLYSYSYRSIYMCIYCTYHIFIYLLIYVFIHIYHNYNLLILIPLVLCTLYLSKYFFFDYSLSLKVLVKHFTSSFTFILTVIS